MAWHDEPTFKPSEEQRKFIHHVRYVDGITVPLIPYKDTFAEVGSFRLMIPSLTTAELGIGLSALSGDVFRSFLTSLTLKQFGKLQQDLQAHAEKAKVGPREFEARCELVRMNAISSELKPIGRALNLRLSDALPLTPNGGNIRVDWPKGLEIGSVVLDEAETIFPNGWPGQEPDFEKQIRDSLQRIARDESPDQSEPVGPGPVTGCDLAVPGSEASVLQVYQEIVRSSIGTAAYSRLATIVEILRKLEERSLIHGDPNAPKPMGVLEALGAFDPTNIPLKDGYVEPEGKKPETKNRKQGWNQSLPWKR